MNQYQVSFGEAVKRALTVNYCKFSGRASRSEYWWFALFSMIVGGLVTLLCNPETTAGQTVSSLVSLVLLLPSLGLVWRRLHDTGRSGWWYVGMFVIVIALAAAGFVCMLAQKIGLSILFFISILAPYIVLIVWFCQPSQPEPNQYGPVPNVE